MRVAESRADLDLCVAINNAVNPEAPAPTDRHRRPGIATALKRAEIAWAAARGYRELVTSSVGGNAAMRAVNEKLGHVTRDVSIMVRAPLPLR